MDELDLKLEQKPELKPDRSPAGGTFELTVRCNLRCKMCFVRHDDHETSALIRMEKTAEEWVDIAEQSARAGTFELLLTGGEPLLRKDFAEIWEGINRVGFVTQLYTNATLVTPDVLSLLKRYPPHSIGVTLYGASEETYEKVTGNGDAYRQTIQGIKQLSILPSVINFRTTLIKDNIHDLAKMEEWVRDNFGSDRVLTNTIMVTKPVRGASADVEACRLSPEENIRLYFRRHFQAIVKVLGPEWKDKAEIKIRKNTGQVKASTPERLTLFGCDAGMRNYTITYDGKMVGCQMLRRWYTEPFKVGFAEAWRRYPVAVRAVREDPKCAVCQHRSLCLSCAATRDVESGNPGGAAPYICANTMELSRYLDKEKRDYGKEEILGTGCPL